LKNVVVRLRRPDGSVEVLAVGVPGDREVDLVRLGAAVAPAEVEPFTDEDFAAHPELAKGYIGPGVLGEGRASGIRYLLDPRVVPGTSWVTGADAEGRHVLGLVCGRDFAGEGVVQAADVREGDPCPACGAPVEVSRGVELGHVFQLGRRYAEALGLRVLGRDGKPVTVTMGSYGIGVSRLVATIAEATLDERGLCWPRLVAPAGVHIVVAGKDAAHREAAEALAADAAASGVAVLLDDRAGVSAGVKLNDADLLGVPTIVVVGRGLSAGVVEVQDRRSGERRDVPVDEAAGVVGR
jgi:prolyl-tRNA synthetase